MHSRARIPSSEVTAESSWQASGLAHWQLGNLPRPSRDWSDNKLAIGASQWMAPVLRGEKATFSPDIYSLGMSILEAVISLV